MSATPAALAAVARTLAAALPDWTITEQFPGCLYGDRGPLPDGRRPRLIVGTVNGYWSADLFADSLDHVDGEEPAATLDTPYSPDHAPADVAAAIAADLQTTILDWSAPDADSLD